MVAASAVPEWAHGSVSLLQPPTRLDFDELVAAGGRVPVSVRNDDDRPQKIEVRLVGLSAAQTKQNPALAGVAPTGAVSEEIPPHAGDVVVLALETSARPQAGTYRGTLVATGSLGESDTSAIALTVADAGAETQLPKSPAPPRLLAEPIGDFGVDGVNFVPSLFNPGPAATFGAGLLLALVLLPFITLGSRLPPWLRRTGFRPKWFKAWHVIAGYLVAALLVIAGAIAAFGEGDAGFFEGSGPSLVEVTSPAVDGDVKAGPVGALVGKDGRVAMAVVEDKQLETRYVPHAGTYAGKVDLLPGADGGDATMTANVRDYWPWALIVIAFGVLVGARVTQYFTQERSKTLASVEIGELRDEIERGEAEYRVRDVDPAGNYSVRERLGERLTAAEALLAQRVTEKTKEAVEEVAAVRSYFRLAQELWSMLERVPWTVGKVATAADRWRFDLHGEEIPAVEQALTLLTKPLEKASLDKDKSELDARMKAVEESLGLLEQLRQTLPAAAAYRDAVAAVKPDAWKDGAAKVALAQHQQTLRTAANKLVAASSAADATEQMSTITAELSSVRDLVKRAGEQENHTALFAPAVMPPAQPFVRPEPSPLRALLTTRTPAEPPASPTGAVSQMRAAFQRMDRQMTLASGMLAVFSGLLVLYSTSPAWGAPGDYLKAFLWGSVVSEGVKAVTALVARTGPSA